MSPPTPPATPPLPSGHVQTVTAAGSRAEMRWVLLTVCIVLLCSALVIAWQRHLQPVQSLQSHQIDLATGLTAIEQGMYTDLQTIHDEWQATGALLPPPAPSIWAQDGWPPFANDLTAQRRGQRQWTLLHIGERYAYLGLPSGDPPPAATTSPTDAERPLLWLLPRQGETAARFDLWLHTAGTARTPPATIRPETLDEATLPGQGWQQIAAHQDALHTPAHHHPASGHTH